MSELTITENMYERVVRPEDEVEGGLLLDVVVGQSPAILQLLACTDERLDREQTKIPDG